MTTWSPCSKKKQPTLSDLVKKYSREVKTIQPDTSSITDYLQLKLDLEQAFHILIKTKLSLSMSYDNFEQTFPSEC